MVTMTDWAELLDHVLDLQGQDVVVGVGGHGGEMAAMFRGRITSTTTVLVGGREAIYVMLNEDAETGFWVRSWSLRGWRWDDDEPPAALVIVDGRAQVHVEVADDQAVSGSGA